MNFQQFSPNMLKTFEQCPKKFFYKYVKNISMPVNDEIFEFGKNIHALASYYLRNENIDNLEQVLTEKEQEVWSYLKSIKYFSCKVIGTEYNLSVKINGNFFGGRLDALVKENENYYILDYKTGAIPKNAKYDFQTMIYMLAVKSFFKTDKITFVYIDLKNKDELKVQYTNNLQNEYEEKIRKTVEKIEKLEFMPIKKDCNCEYSLICY